MARASLNSLVLPGGGPLRRDHAVPEGSREPSYDARYDFQTLAYDAVHLPQFGAICLICPRLFNLGDVLRRGRFTSEWGRHRILKVNRLRRYEEVWLWAPRGAQRLTFHHGDLELTCAVTGQDRETFRGLKAGVTLSRNNDLAWIRDWVRFHVRQHGLEAMLFFDNGSDLYGLEDIEDVLAGVRGLKTFRVVSAPHPFGPMGRKPHAFRSNFLQPALLNLARIRFLSRAKAVLQADIDELFVPKNDQTVFDAALASPFGYALFDGSWRYAPRIAGDRPRHADHVFHDPQSARPETKYCIRPKSLFGHIHWEVHGVVKGFMKKRFIHPGIRYLHCAQISTNWKAVRGIPHPERLERDPMAEALMAEMFPAPAPQGAPAISAAVNAPDR